MRFKKKCALDVCTQELILPIWRKKVKIRKSLNFSWAFFIFKVFFDWAVRTIQATIFGVIFDTIEYLYSSPYVKTRFWEFSKWQSSVIFLGCFMVLFKNFENSCITTDIFPKKWPKKFLKNVNPSGRCHCVEETHFFGAKKPDFWFF